MKKVLSVLLVLLVLCGCGSKDSEITNLDYEKTITDLDNSYSNMVELSADELSLVYGLEVSNCEKYMIKSSTLANGDFYAILKVSKDNTSAVKSQMQNLFATLESQSNLYSPDAVNLIKNRLETTIGDYLIYLVGKDTNALYEIVKNNIK